MMLAYPFDCLPVHPPPEDLESFTSYMIRLAEVNQVRSVYALLALLCPERNFRPHLRLYNTDTLLRPFPRFAAAAHCSLERLRESTVYHLLTKFGLSVALPFLQNSLADCLRYCPDCLREAGYYRLDWRFLTLPGCERHGKRLLDRCGYCAQSIPLLNPCLRIGICPHCQGDLRQCEALLLSEEDWQLTRLRTSDLAYLLSPQSWEADAPAMRARAGAYLSCQRQEQRLSSLRLAQQLGVPQPCLRSIESLQARREGVCFQLNLAYTDALQTTWSATFAYVSQHPELPQNATQLRANRLLQRIEQAIDHMERSGQPLTKIALSRAVNLSPECFVLYPDIKRLMESLPERARQQADRLWLQAAQAAVTDLRSTGEPLTLSAIHQRVPRFPRQFARYPQLRAFLAQYFAVARPSPEGLPSAHPQEALLLQRLTSVTTQLAAQDQKVTVSILAQALGISLATVYAYPTLRAHIALARHFCKMAQQKRIEAGFLQQAQYLIDDLTRRGQRCSIQVICQALGKPYVVLAKYPRLYALFQQVKAPPGWHKVSR